MAASDAKPVPVRNQAYRVTFPILDNDGDPVESGTGLDSEYSLDGGAFADCSSEAVHFGNGAYYLDLTAAEMDADTVTVVVKSSSANSKDTVLVFYPQEPGDIPVDVESIAASEAAAARMSLSALEIIPYTVDTGVAAATTTRFRTSDITEATADHFNGRIIVWTTGALKSQAARIEDYRAVGGLGDFTVSEMTEIPAHGDTGIIL